VNPRPGRPAGAAGGALVALAVLVAVTACSTGSGGDGPSGVAAADGEAVGAAEATSVLVLGDSLTVGADLWGDLEETLAADGWAAEVDAEDGQGVGWGIERVRTRSEVPATVVVGLGTNPGGSPETFASDVTTLVDELVRRGARTVLWWPPAPGGSPDDATGRSQRADAVRAAAGGPLAVPDWPSEVAAHPDWVGPDGIHLTHAGYRQLSGFIGRQLTGLRP
jgi:hypothetical protein